MFYKYFLNTYNNFSIVDFYKKNLVKLEKFVKYNNLK